MMAIVMILMGVFLPFLGGAALGLACAAVAISIMKKLDASERALKTTGGILFVGFCGLGSLVYFYIAIFLLPVHLAAGTYIWLRIHPYIVKVPAARGPLPALLLAVAAAIFVFTIVNGSMISRGLLIDARTDFEFARLKIVLIQIFGSVWAVAAFGLVYSRFHK